MSRRCYVAITYGVHPLITIIARDRKRQRFAAKNGFDLTTTVIAAGGGITPDRSAKRVSTHVFGGRAERLAGRPASGGERYRRRVERRPRGDLVTVLETRNRIQARKDIEAITVALRHVDEAEV